MFIVITFVVINDQEKSLS